MDEPRHHDASPSRWYKDLEMALPATLKGRVICVTGCTSGTGLVLAEFCAARGAKVVMLNRPSKRADDALAEVRRVAKKYKKDVQNISLVPCDLQEFQSVRTAAAALHHKCQLGIDVLCNNSGVVALPNVPTTDGFAGEIQANHLGHFLLTAEVWPLLERAAQARGESRVVNHTSSASQLVWMPFFHGLRQGVQTRFFENDMSNVGHPTSFIGRAQRCSESKYANVVFTHALATKQSIVKSLCAHPGVVVANPVPDQSRGCCMTCEPTQQNTEDGAMGILAACLLPEAKSGEIWGPAGFGRAGPVVGEEITSGMGCLTQSRDESVTRLWEVSEAAIGTDFVFLSDVRDEVSTPQKRPSLPRVSSRSFSPLWD